MKPDYFQKLECALAPERIDAYRQDGANQSVTMARYLWNMALCESLYPTLQIAEVALRNSLHQTLTNHFNSNEWYNQATKLPKWQSDQIETAKQKLRTNRKPVTHGRIVAELSFGFWTGFFNKAHLSNGLGFMLSGKAFPHAQKSQREVRKLNTRWKQVRDLRNRVFHHERIIHWEDLDDQHSNIQEVTGWISPELAKLSKTLDRYTQTRKAGLKPWLDKMDL